MPAIATKMKAENEEATKLLVDIPYGGIYCRQNCGVRSWLWRNQRGTRTSWQNAWIWTEQNLMNLNFLTHIENDNWCMGMGDLLRRYEFQKNLKS